MSRVTIIVARAANGTIGRDNGLPWRLPEDLRHFKAATMGHAVIMGRKTFDSIGRPLPGRRIIVVSRDPGWRHDGCERAGSLREAIALAAGSDDVFVAGGAQIYREALPLADRAIVTEVAIEAEGDAHFAELDPAHWRLVSREPHRSETGLGYAIAVYERRDRQGPSTLANSSSAR